MALDQSKDGSDSGSGFLQPASGDGYAAVAPGNVGTIAFNEFSTNAMGALHHFNYACAVPAESDPPTPYPCTITVTAYCQTKAVAFPLLPILAKITAILNFEPSTNGLTGSDTGSGMAYMLQDFAATYGGDLVELPQRCVNYTFQAAGVNALADSVGPSGTVVIPSGGFKPGPVLLIDDVEYDVFA